MDYPAHPRRPYYNHSRPQGEHSRSGAWQNRDHPSQRSRSHVSWQDRGPENYISCSWQDRSEMCASRPLTTNDPKGPFYRHYIHTDPLGLNIDLSRVDEVVRGAAINVAMFHSHPNMMEKTDNKFLGQQVSYLEHVIKAMKNVITKNMGILKPLPVTEERSTMRRTASLKRHFVSASENVPIFNMRKQETEKEEGELDEEGPTTKKMRLDLEKKTETRDPPFVGLPLSPISEDDEEIKTPQEPSTRLTLSPVLSEDEVEEEKNRQMQIAWYKEKKTALEAAYKKETEERAKPSTRLPHSEDESEEENRKRLIISQRNQKEIERRAALAAASEKDRDSLKKEDVEPSMPLIFQDDSPFVRKPYPQK